MTSKRFIVGVIAFLVTNLVMIAVETCLISIAAGIIIPLNYYTPEQFVNIMSFLSFGGLCFGNLILIKGGMYDAIKRNF
jgi:hypothetical protein